MGSHAASRPKIGALRALAELCLTLATIIALYLTWTALVNPAIVGARQETAAAQQSARFEKVEPRVPAQAVPAASVGTPETAVPVSKAPTVEATPIAVIYIPRLGDSWKRVIREGTDTVKVLDSFSAGVGHYTGTAMPGGVGNFAIAAHDTGYGNSFLGLSQLKLGDKIYVQTADGWYTYEFRNFQFVQPSAVDVIDPVPTVPSATASQRLITLTTCDPPFHAQERTIAYGTWVSFDTVAPAVLAGKV